MAINDKDLILYLPLDDIRSDGMVQDASDLATHGAVKGNVTLVPDDIFGGCLSFNEEGKGGHIIVSKLGLTGANLAHTIEAWIYVDAYPAGRSWPLLLGQPGVGAHHWLLAPDGSAQLGVWSGPQFHPVIPKKKWTHIALVNDKQMLSCYVNGIAYEKPQPAKFNITAMNLTLALGAIGELDFSGKIANLRIYKRPLSQAEIQRDIRADQMSLVAFRKSHPIDFRVYDDDEQPALYISDGLADRNLNVELHNTSTQVIQLNGQNATASADNHHFALRFRPGTLSDGALKLLINPQERAKILKQSDQWDLYFSSNLPAANENASLYLLYKGPSNSFQPDERRALTLQRMSAAPASGARGTQVELIPRQLTATGGDTTPITGSRSQYVHITNHLGKKNIPLHVGFVGNNTVLNNGEPQKKPLQLRITNVSKDGAITLNPASSTAPSKFIISFDVQHQDKTMDWALTTSVLAKRVKVSFDNRDFTPQVQGETLQWPVTFNSPISLNAGAHIQVDIAGIISSLPSGHANLYVRYENIPGYWDGQFVCRVEKGPIVTDNGNVGIGTGAPIAKVEVAGGIVAENLSVARVNERRGGLFFAMAGDFNHAIYNNLSNIDGGGAWDGANWNTGNGLRIRVGQTPQKKLALAINENGNVGIGKPGPEKALDVSGDASVSGQLAAGNVIAPNLSITKTNVTVAGQTGTFIRGSANFDFPAEGFQSPASGTHSRWTGTMDGACVFGANGGVLGTTNGGEKITLYWNSEGNVRVRGYIAAQTKFFRIDHPTKAGQDLVHACLEGPENSVYYRGSARLRDGEATITLPEYFEALTRKEGRTVLLTAKGKEPFRLSYEDIKDGRFKVYGTSHSGEFSWEVKAVRADVGELETEVPNS